MSFLQSRTASPTLVAGAWSVASALVSGVLLLAGASPLAIVFIAGIAAAVGALRPAASLIWFGIAAGLAIPAAVPALRLLALML